MLPAKQSQQHEHPLVRTQGSEYPNLLAQQAADDPHPRAGREPARPLGIGTGTVQRIAKERAMSPRGAQQ